MKGAINLSFRIDDQIKKEFQEETYYNGLEMTEVVEEFMKKYSEISKNARKESKD